MMVFLSSRLPISSGYTPSADGSKRRIFNSPMNRGMLNFAGLPTCINENLYSIYFHLQIHNMRIILNPPEVDRIYVFLFSTIFPYFSVMFFDMFILFSHLFTRNHGASSIQVATPGINTQASMLAPTARVETKSKAKVSLAKGRQVEPLQMPNLF